MVRLIIFISLIASTLSYGQDLNNLMIKRGADGNHIYLSDQAISADSPYQGYEKVEISKATNDKSFTVIATISRPATREEFTDICGDEWWVSFIYAKNLDDESGWQFILDHPKLDDYGFRSLDPNFMQAMGAAFLDKSAAETKDGTTFTYRAKYISAQPDSSITRTGAIRVGEKPNTGKPKVINTIERDSVLSVTWYSSSSSSPDAFSATVYRQEGGSGPYEPLSSSLLANHNGDSIIYSLQDQVVPEHMYRYFIVPATMEGLQGNPSDTVTLLSLNLARVPLLKNVQTKDTTSGLHLTLDSLTYKPYWAGIEISRSRDARGNYVRLDTLGVTKREYIDTRVKPNTVYYYRLKALTVLNDTVSASATTSGVHINKDQPPLAPLNLSAAKEGNNIRLNWSNNTEEDLAGYYVLRATEVRDTFSVISPLIYENAFVDTVRLSGRKTYTYVVQAMNQGDLLSEASNEVSIRPKNTQKPEMPNGLIGYSEPGYVALNWKNMQDLDPLIKGYNVYRKSASTSIKEGIYNMEELNKQGFKKLNNAPIASNTFDDKQVAMGEKYIYMLTATDIYNIESDASDYIAIDIPLPDLSPPVGFTGRKTSKGIVLNWSATNQLGAEGYTIYRRTAETQPAVISQLSLNETEFIDNGVQSGKLYFYSIDTRGKQDKRSVKSKEKNVRY